MTRSLLETSAPSVEPVTLAQARSQCRLVASGSPPTHPDDDQLEIYIAAARSAAEDFCNRPFVQRSIAWRFDRFDSDNQQLKIPTGQVRSITSISYVDTDGNPQSFTDFTFLPTNLGGILVPDYNFEWPDVRGHLGDVTITFVAGYEDDGASPPDLTANIPVPIKSAILLYTAHLYMNREAVTDGAKNEMPLGVRDLLWPYRIPGL